jgi:hypothetical protein
VYGMTLGDITFDSTNLWGNMKSTMSNLKTGTGSWFPIFQCIGNHDHNSLVKSNDYEATEKYVEFFGPTDYSFDRGKVHIIVMDDIMCTTVNSNSSPNKATWSYGAGFTQAQYKWFLQDLDQVQDKADKADVEALSAQVASNTERILNTYTKPEVNNLLASYYTKLQTNSMFGNYSKVEDTTLILNSENITI